MQLSDRAYVISLRGHLEKLNGTLERLENAGFERIIPHVATKPSKEDLRKYYKGRVVPLWATGRKIATPGALGCLQSHKKVLEKIVNNRHPAFIFEDDIRIHKNFRWLFANAASATNGCQWVYLGCSQLKWRKMARTKPAYTAKLSLGTFAYWVSEYAAKILLENISTWNTSVDQYYARFLQRKYGVKVCYPYLAIADVSSSDTGNGKRDIQKVKGIYGWNPKDYV